MFVTLWQLQQCMIPEFMIFTESLEGKKDDNCISFNILSNVIFLSKLVDESEHHFQPAMYFKNKKSDNTSRI